MKKSLTFSMTITLTLVILLSIVGSALAQENKVAAMILLPALLILGVVLVERRTLRGRRRAVKI